MAGTTTATVHATGVPAAVRVSTAIGDRCGRTHGNGEFSNTVLLCVPFGGGCEMEFVFLRHRGIAIFFKLTICFGFIKNFVFHFVYTYIFQNTL